MRTHESMFETFLKTAHQNDQRSAEERALNEAMKKLPSEVLFKLANGETKIAFGDDGGSGSLGWVGQFKDTPLFEQALGLEQQAIQLEQMEQQHRAQRDAEREQEPKFWEMQDRVRLQKRLLSLQLAAGQLQQAGAAMAPNAAGAAPPPPEVAEAAGGAAPSPADGKVAFSLLEPLFGGPSINNPAFKAGLEAQKKHLASGGSRMTSGEAFASGYKEHQKEKGEKKEAFDHAAELGRRMALGDYDRAVTTNAAAELGRELAKTAFALTDAGHKFDAADYGAQRDAVGARREARKDYRKEAPGMHIGHSAGELIGFTSGAAPLLGLSGPGIVSELADIYRERNNNYAAKKHEAGNNAYNPLGGLLTPTARENKLKEKKALDANALAGLGQKAVGFLGKNPGAALGAATGAIVGTGGGLVNGLQKDQQGNRHILKGLAQGVAGAAGGALAGHAVQNVGGAMRGGASLGQAVKGYGQQLQQVGGQAAAHIQGALRPAAAGAGAAPAAAAAPTAVAATGATRALAPTLQAGAQGRVAPTMPMASKNPSLVGATNQALNFQRAPAGVQAAVKSNPLVASGEIPPEAAHQLMSWSAKGGVTPQAIQQMNSKTPRPAGFVDPREAATRAGG